MGTITLSFMVAMSLTGYLTLLFNDIEKEKESYHGNLKCFAIGLAITIIAWFVFLCIITHDPNMDIFGAKYH